jgi:hypothetical protein
MESNTYFYCTEKEAEFLRDFVFNLAKQVKSYNGYYTSTPSVMLSINDQLLMDNTGLTYSFYNYNERKYIFVVVDEKKLMLFRLKYGI